MAAKKVIIQRRTVKAKSIQNIFEAVETQENLRAKHPGAPIEIERTQGGGMHAYRVVIVEPVEVEMPEKPELDALPYPEFLPQRSHFGGRNRPNFGGRGQFNGDHAFRNEVHKKNGEVFQANKRKLNEVEDQVISPRFRKRT